MIYIKCPSCMTVLANRQIKYEKGLEKIMNENTNEETKKLKKTELLHSLKLNNLCCKMRVMSFVKLVDIIL